MSNSNNQRVFILIAERKVLQVFTALQMHSHEVETEPLRVQDWALSIQKKDLISKLFVYQFESITIFF